MPTPPASPRRTAFGDLLTVEQVASRLAVSTKTVRRMVASGELEAVRIRSRMLRIPESAVDALGRPVGWVGR